MITRSINIMAKARLTCTRVMNADIGPFCTKWVIHRISKRMTLVGLLKMISRFLSVRPGYRKARKVETGPVYTRVRKVDKG